MSTVFHHYALIDPRVEDEILRVRYIGRTIHTIDKRYRGHLRITRAGGRSHRDNWMRQLLGVGLEPIVLDLGVGDENRESELIAHWKALGARLTNRTLGGDGAKGLQWTEERKANRSISAREVAARPGWKQAVAERTREALSSPEVREKISLGVRTHLQTPGVRERRAEATRLVLQRPDVRAKLYTEEAQRHRGEAGRRSLARPEVREKVNAAIRSPEVRAKRSEYQREARLRQRQNDPTFEQTKLLYQEGITQPEIARRLGITYGAVVGRLRRMRKAGLL